MALYQEVHWVRGNENGWTLLHKTARTDDRTAWIARVVEHENGLEAWVPERVFPSPYFPLGQHQVACRAVEMFLGIKSGGDIWKLEELVDEER